MTFAIVLAKVIGLFWHYVLKNLKRAYNLLHSKDFRSRKLYTEKKKMKNMELLNAIHKSTRSKGFTFLCPICGITILSFSFLNLCKKCTNCFFPALHPLLYLLSVDAINQPNLSKRMRIQTNIIMRRIFFDPLLSFQIPTKNSI